MHSRLVSAVYIAHSGNYQVGRSGYRICKITPHQMAGKLTGKQCAVNVFGKVGRKASANYCIGYEGDIVCNVEEENRAYTSASKWNDCQAITIEISNTANGTDRITDASWNSLVNLCVDICKRHNFRLKYDGTKNGSLTRHNMFVNTNCPGTYLQSRFSELARIVNERLDGTTGKKAQVQKGGYDMKSYKNGSKAEVVFQDSNCINKIGSLNPYEACDCLGEFTNGKNEKVAVVMYTIDGSKPADRKVGFVKYIAGIGK